MLRRDVSLRHKDSRAAQRQAQETSPGLYLGSSDAARDLAFVHSTNISAIIIVYAKETDVKTTRPDFAQAFRYRLFQLEDDASTEDILWRVAVLRSELAACREQSQNVLVHDEEGVSRAPALIILYMMINFDLRYDQALAHVRSIRPCVSLSAEMTALCRRIESFAHSSGSARVVRNSSLKRGSEHVDAPDHVKTDGYDVRAEHQRKHAAV